MAELDRTDRKGESLFQEAMVAFERNLLVRALEKNGWNVTAPRATSACRSAR